jgi:hypothetical protein
MGVKMTRLPNGQAEFSYDGTFTNPVTWAVTPAGGRLEIQYYLSMDDPSQEYCVEGRLYATDSSGADESSWFSFAPDVDGSPGTWASEMEFEIAVDEEVPFWVRLDAPANIDEDTRDDISLALSYIRLEVE